MDRNNELDLLKKSKTGDTTAFKILVETHQTFAFRVAFRMLGSEEDSMDIVQESFIRVWKNLNKYNHEIKFTTWLYKIVTNLCLDQLKMKKRKKYNHTIQVDFIKNISNDDGMEKQIVNDDLASFVKVLSEHLTPKQQVVFTLHFLEEKSMDEISRITGMKKGNIKSNIYYARKNMQEMIEKMM